MLDPADLYEVDSDVPDLHDAVLIHRLDGFVDAGSAGELLADHLLSTFEHRVIARFDVDSLIDYRARRPAMRFVTDHWEHYQTPELVVHLLHDTAGTPFLLLTGPEPDHNWEAFCAAVIELVERWGARLTVGVHGIPMGVPHTRPLGVTAHATRTELIGEFNQMPSQIQVPGSASALLELRLGELGRDAAGFAAHVPHYLSQSAYPSASVELLEHLVRLTGLVIPTATLQEAAEAAVVEVNRQVGESTEVGDVVAALERQYDSFTEATEQNNSLLAEAKGHMPTAEELGSVFEQFLAEQQGYADPPEH